MHKKLIACILAVVFAVMMVGCSTTDAVVSEAAAEAEASSAPAASSVAASTASEATGSGGGTDGLPEGLKIAIVPQSLNDPYQVTWSNAAKARCEELGYTCDVLGAGSGDFSDVQGQMEVIENIISNGTYDGVLLASMSKDGAVVMIKNLQDANLPVVIVDAQADQDALEADGYERAPYIGTPNFEAAQATGEWIREHYPEGVKMAKINGPDGSDNGIARKDGLDAGLDGWADVVAEQSSTNWSVDDAYVATQNIMTANPDIELIFNACDALGIGCLRALEEMGKADQVDVMAYDGTIDGLDLVIAGDEVSNTAQLADTMGIGAIDLLARVVAGEEVDLINNSGFEIIDTPEKAQELKDRLAQYME